MKRFHFPLQPLRTLREQQEQAAQRHYAEAMRAVEAAEQRVRETLAELESCWSWLRQRMTDGAFTQRLESTRAYCAVLGERSKQEEADLHREQQRLHGAWEALVCATRDREALDRFFEKCRRAYDRQVQRAEQKILDELGRRRTGAEVGAGSLSFAKLEMV